jgi:hypothetical protein
MEEAMNYAEIWHAGLASLFAIVPGATLVVALSSWLGKVWASRILEGDRVKYQREMAEVSASYERKSAFLRSELEKTVYVSRLHFETEFAALKEIWSALAEVRGVFVEIRSAGISLPTIETQAETINRQVAAFGEGYNKLSKAVHHNSPFYPKCIFDEVAKLIGIAYLEYFQVATMRPPGEWWFKGADENREAFVTGAGRLSDLIRERIDELAIRIPV